MEELLKEYIKNGNIEYFEKLVNNLRKYLYVVAKARLFDEFMVEDALQETFILLYMNYRKIKDITKFKTWITTVLINECNKILKNNKKMKLYYEDLDGFEFNISKEDLESDVDNLIKKIDFYQIIKCLSIEDRTIISMYYSDGYTIKDISYIMNLNINTVKTRIDRAKKKIKKSLGGMC